MRFPHPPPYPPGPERSTELRRLFADEARSERPDLTTLCLLMGGVADRALDDAGVDAVQMELDRLAGQLPFRPGGPRSWATALHELLGERLGFRGSPADYQRLESSLLHEVVVRRRGLPILLSVLWMEVARRAGAPVYGVALPGHFVVGFGPVDQQVLADPFDGAGVERGRRGAAGGRGDRGGAGSVDAGAGGSVGCGAASTEQHSGVGGGAAGRSEVSLWAVELALLLPSHPARLRYERAQLLVGRGSS